MYQIMLFAIICVVTIISGCNPLGTPEESRSYFKALRVLRDQLKTEALPLKHLSMGTSHDFEVAIEEGATWVRLGQALFKSLE